MLKKLVKASGYILQQVFLNCNWIDLLGTIQPSRKKCVVLMCLCLHESLLCSIVFKVEEIRF